MPFSWVCWYSAWLSSPFPVSIWLIMHCCNCHFPCIGKERSLLAENYEELFLKIYFQIGRHCPDDPHNFGWTRLSQSTLGDEFTCCIQVRSRWSDLFRFKWSLVCNFNSLLLSRTLGNSAGFGFVLAQVIVALNIHMNIPDIVQPLREKAPLKRSKCWTYFQWIFWCFDRIDELILSGTYLSPWLLLCVWTSY